MSDDTILVHPTTLVLSGGGMNGFNILGGLSYLNDKKYLESVTTFIGTSVGALIGYLLCIGYTPIEIVVYFETKNIGRSMGHIDLVSMINGAGASSYSVLQTHLEKMTIEKVGQFFTMEDLEKKLGKKLVVCTYNLSENKAEYISATNNPSLPCLTALRMTSNLPFIFEEFKYMGSFYIDGGIIDNFPILEANPEEKVLGLSIDPRSRYKKDIDKHNFIEFIFHLMMIPVNKDIEAKTEEALRRGHSVIKLSKKGFANFIDFSMKNNETLDLFSDGYNDVKNFYESS
jgi:predicted acylesterase/phospholipase RssA